MKKKKRRKTSQTWVRMDRTSDPTKSVKAMNGTLIKIKTNWLKCVSCNETIKIEFPGLYSFRPYRTLNNSTWVDTNSNEAQVERMRLSASIKLHSMPATFEWMISKRDCANILFSCAIPAIHSNRGQSNKKSFSLKAFNYHFVVDVMSSHTQKNKFTR